MKNFRLEKDTVLGVWIVFKRVGTSGWQEIHRDKKKMDAKKWLEKEEKTQKTS